MRFHYWNREISNEVFSRVEMISWREEKGGGKKGEKLFAILKFCICRTLLVVVVVVVVVVRAEFKF